MYIKCIAINVAWCVVLHMCEVDFSPVVSFSASVKSKREAALAAALLDLSHYALIKKCHERSRVFYFY